MFQCAHCDEEALTPVYLAADPEHALPFCCSGCLTVYEVLKEKSLSSYYEIKNSSALLKRRSPVVLSSSTYAYLDREDFLADHCYDNGGSQKIMDFYLEGIHCLACLWLIEKLPQILKGVRSAKLDLERSVASVSITDEGKFSEVARELDQLGYRPHALNRNGDSAALKAREERSYLKRLGIAGAAAGNIMIYSFALYGGASETLGKVFNAITVVLGVPVFTYCAYPFYQSAWTSLKNRTVSIDIPISMALIMGMGMGLWGLFHGFRENYFDSLTALVFLLLLSRYFLRKIQDRGLSPTDLHYFHQQESVLRQSGAGFEEIHSRYVKTGDILKVKCGDIFPADGKILDGTSLVNNSLLTGESLPVPVTVGDRIFSGTQNVGQDLLIRVDTIKADTRLGKILRQVEQGWTSKSRTVDLTSEVARYFTLAVIFLSIFLFVTLAGKEGYSIALSRALTLLIVTCPCALAISVPLTFHRSLSLAARNGLIVKSDEVFEKLIRVRNIFLDKTGTVTLGQLEVIRFQSSSAQDIFSILFSLESRSHHPVAKALTEFSQKQGAKTLDVTEYREIPGKGVEGRINGSLYSVSDSKVFRDGEEVASFEVRDGIRSDSAEVIEELQNEGLSVFLLSGDKERVVKKLAHEAGITPARAYHSVGPEEKVRIVSSPDSVMVGDGANDAMALEGAGVGIAVSGAMEISLRAADVYLTTPGLSGVTKLITLSRETMKVVRRNLILSLIYNSLSVFFVFTGVINPLIAAIVMPVSSLTVLISTLIGTGKLRKIWKS